MTRVYRDQPRGMTYVERGSGGPVLRVPDHGEAEHLWTPPPLGQLVYDDELHASPGSHGENDHLTEARDRLLKAVGESKIPPTSKADVRRIIGEVIK